MISNSYAVRFTDETYATKKDISTKLGTSLIDSIYHEVISYRKANSVATSLLLLDRQCLCITKTDVLKARYQSFANKLSSFLKEYSSLSAFDDLKAQFDRFAINNCLKNAAATEKINISDSAISAICTSFFSGGETGADALIGYKNLLVSLLGDDNHAPNEDFLAFCLGKITRQEELTSFYRDSDIKSLLNRSLVSNVYDFAPFGKIESMMESLFSYVANDKALPYIKAIVALYYFYYIKPFGVNDSMICSSFARAILLNSEYKAIAGLLPFDEALAPSDRLNAIFAEVQKRGDVTHFLLYAMERVAACLDRYLDQIVKIKSKAILNERNFVEENPIAPLIEEKSEPIGESPQIESKPIPPEESKPEEEESKLKVIEEVSVKKTSIPQIKQMPPSEAYERALGKIEMANLSDKELKEAAKYIMEINPNIKKAQALFYAGHCTLGRYYSIQDFKKSAKCAYETARTSMDGLAKYGFYQKCAIKNKFVYTPIKQGENQ